MAEYGWDGSKVTVLVPESGQTVNGTPFTIPKGAKSMAIHIGAIAAGIITFKVQALDPVATVSGLIRADETWRDVAIFDLTDGTTELLDAIPESQVTVIPVTALTGGVLRLVASADLSAEIQTIQITFGMDG